MITNKAVSRMPRHRCGTRHAIVVFCMVGAVAVAGPVLATPAYDTGPLDFATQNQSMWGSNGAFVQSGSKFIGTTWDDKTSTIGGFFGSAGATNPLYTLWQGCQDAFSWLGGCGSPPSPTINTTTGAEVGLQSSGKFGLNFGYTVNNGSIKAGVDFGATADVPRTVQKQQFFDLGTVSSLNSGSIKTQSPDATANIGLVAKFSGSAFGKGCFFGSCSASSSPLPSVDINQKIFALTPNALEVMPGLIPNGTSHGSLAHIALGAQDVPITWNESEIGSVSTNLPDVTTKGHLQGNSISSSGSDPLLTAKINIADLSSLAGFPTNAEVNVIEPGFVFEAGLAPLDLEIGPQLSLGQNFDLKPTLMVNLAFSRPVQIAGEAAPQDSWQGAWADLPALALFGTTTFTPTFWLDAPLTNSTDLDLGLVGTYDFLKLEFKLDVPPLPPLNFSESLSQLLGLSGNLFSTPTLDFPIWDNTFQLEGFSPIAGKKFTIYTGSLAAVPEPPDLPLFLLGLGALPLLVYLGKLCDVRDASGRFRRKGAGHA